MAIFQNTVDTVGDVAITDSLINRTITELNDNIVEVVGKSAFRDCAALTKVNFPNTSLIDNDSFVNCSSLQVADFSKLTSIGTDSFSNCDALEALIIRNYDKIPTINNRFGSCGIGNGGYVYVPSVLLDGYKSSSIWSNYSDYIRAIENYPEVCSNLGKVYDSRSFDYFSTKFIFKCNGIMFLCSDNSIRYSTDGKTWTIGHMVSNSERIVDIQYNNGIYVLCTKTLYSSVSGGLYYSEDNCQTLVRSNIYEDGCSCYAIAHSDNMWVAGGSKGAYYSEDGKTWTKIDDLIYVEKIIYANGVFVAGCYNSRGLYYSEDGKIWTKVNDFSGQFYDVAYGNGIFVASNDKYSGNNFFTSTDGRTWSGVKFSSLCSGVSSANRIFYLNNKWLILAGTKIYCSDNLVTFETDTESGKKYTVCDMIYANHVYIAYSGYESSYNMSGLLYSVDGIKWYESNITYVANINDTGNYHLLYYDDTNNVLYATHQNLYYSELT